MIFLDTASTTRVKSKVKTAINYYFDKNYANPLANYEYTSEPLEAIEKSRKIIADILHCEPKEIYFTSGGSEANSMAIKGLAFQKYKLNKEKSHIITTAIEHHSVLNACKELEELGMSEVTYLPVSSEGIVSEEDLKNAIQPNTILISIGYVNNEIGIIQNINQFTKIAAEKGILFHTDAVQAYGKLPINVKNISMLSASGHKWGAPKGIGFLMVKEGIELAPIISGGHQERGIRGGTHNVPYIAGMGVASQLAEINRRKNYDHEDSYRLDLFQKLQTALPKMKINGNKAISVPNILNLNFYEYGVRGEELLAFLNEKGIYVSTGSACATGEPSHVLKALGLSDDEVDCSIRCSFNENNKTTEVDTVVEAIIQAVQLLGKR